MKPQSHSNTQEEYIAQIAQLEEKFAAPEADMINKYETKILHTPQQDKAAILKLETELQDGILNLHKEKEAEIAKIRKPEKPLFMGEMYSNPDLVGEY